MHQFLRGGLECHKKEERTVVQESAEDEGGCRRGGRGESPMSHFRVFPKSNKKHKNAFSIKLFPPYIQNLYKTVKS